MKNRVDKEKHCVTRKFKYYKSETIVNNKLIRFTHEIFEKKSGNRFVPFIPKSGGNGGRAFIESACYEIHPRRGYYAMVTRDWVVIYDLREVEDKMSK